MNLYKVCMTPILGLDIGGANLKAAHSDRTARTVPFALWKHPDQLADEIARLMAAMPSHRSIAATMTGELCDCFATKRDGVLAILRSIRAASSNLPIHVWSIQGRFLRFDHAMEDPTSVAAANWLALAHFVAQLFPQDTILLIDSGSTTTDLVSINRGVVEARALTDPGRLASGELVYTGLRRTPLCAVLGMSVAAEFFATMLDAYLFLGLIPEDAHDCDTADGRPATRACAHARLARLRCAEVEAFREAEARHLAIQAVTVQQGHIQQAVNRVLAGRRSPSRIVLSGSGEILGRGVVEREPAWSGLPVTSLRTVLGPALSEAACAYALAILAQEEGE